MAKAGGKEASGNAHDWPRSTSCARELRDPPISSTAHTAARLSEVAFTFRTLLPYDGRPARGQVRTVL